MMGPEIYHLLPAQGKDHYVKLQTLRKKCPYSELFWFVFSPNVEKYGPE